MIATLAEPSVSPFEIGETPYVSRGDDDRGVMVAPAQANADVPDDRWSLAKLTARAVAEQKVIDAADRVPTLHYWFQGRHSTRRESTLLRARGAITCGRAT